MAVTFDTLKLVRRLPEGGRSAEQAETVAAASAQATGEALATRADPALRRAELETEIPRQTARVGAIVVATVGVATAIIKLG